MCPNGIGKARSEMLMAVNAATGKRHTVTVVKDIHSFPSRSLSIDEPLLAGRIAALFAAARRLRADAHSGAVGKTLRGKNLALLQTVPPGRETSPLHRAAQDLGVRVAEVRFETGGPTQPDIGTLARLLGRMYDAIDCGALPPPTVQRIELEAGVPVYAGLGLDDHPARVLADLMTLCEHGSPPVPPGTILFLGDSQTGRSRAFLSAAREMGFALHVAEPGGSASNEATFVVDAMHSPHWSLHGSGHPIDEARRSENHRCVMQIVLLDTMAQA